MRFCVGWLCLYNAAEVQHFGDAEHVYHASVDWQALGHDCYILATAQQWFLRPYETSGCSFGLVVMHWLHALLD
jgi:hypothetical protein